MNSRGTIYNLVSQFHCCKYLQDTVTSKEYLLGKTFLEDILLSSKECLSKLGSNYLQDTS